MLLAWLVFSSWVNATTLSLPVTLGGKQIGNLSTRVSGTDIDAVSLPELKALLGSRVSQDIWAALTESSGEGSSEWITLNHLDQNGINVELNMSSLSLAVRIARHAFGKRDLDFGRNYEVFSPTPSGSISWLNSMNFIHQENWEQGLDNRASSIDWLTQWNFGGSDGVNFTAANYIEFSGDAPRFLRGEWTFFYDNTDIPTRVGLGDVVSGRPGGGIAANIGGISVESNYRELQPNRSIGPGNDQEVVLPESAELEVFVNNQVIYSGLQEAGRFNLANLPLTHGANDITVQITYLSGKTETLVFTNFYNNKLLTKGMLNYSLAAGVPSVFNEEGIDYTDAWLVSGVSEYGVSQWLTLGANGISARYGNMAGVVATLGTDIGNFSNRFTFSEGKNRTDGSLWSVDFESTVWGASDGGSPNLRFSYSEANRFLFSPWEKTSDTLSYKRYLASYGWNFNRQWKLSISGSYYQEYKQASEFNGTATLNWQYGNINWGAGVSLRENEKAGDDDIAYFLTFNWRWSHPKHGYSLRTDYDSVNNRAQLDMFKSNAGYVGAVGYRLRADYDDSQNRQSAQLDYVANRARFEVEFGRGARHSGGDAEGYFATLRGNTAIGMVDGHWGWGRAQPGPFLVTNLHPTLSHQHVRIGLDQEEKYKAVATSAFGSLVPLSKAYLPNTIDIYVPDAPAGYDWGESRLNISPGAATGHFNLVGSARSYTAKGVLKDTSGKPVSYLQGKISRDGNDLPFFTNKAGRFFIQGVGTGSYLMTMTDKRYGAIEVTINNPKAHLVDLGTVIIPCAEESCDEEP